MKECPPRCRRLLGLVALALTAFSPVLAGTLPLQWDPVADPGVEGYYVYWGSGPGDYSSSRRVYATGTTLDLNVADCPSQPHYISVKAWNGESESLHFADAIAGFPQAVLTAGSQSPSQLELPQPGEPERRIDVRVSGTNFRAGATVGFRVVSGSGVTVEPGSARYFSCTQVGATLLVSESAPVGATARVEVTLEDIPQDRPAGTQTYALPRTYSFTLVEPPSEFAVTSATPSDSSTGVDPGVTVQVRFNRPLNPKKVTGNRIKIKRVGSPGRSKGKARLATGSPRLESDGSTVTMTINGALAGDERYAVWVKGGGKGIKNVDGETLPSAWQQVPGFVTRAFLEDISYSASPSSAGSSLVPSAEVPTTSVLVLEFSEAVAATSIKKSNPMIKWPGKGKIPLLGGQARLSADGRSIILEPAGSLPAGSRLLLIVKGQKLGVKSARGVILTESKITTEFTTPVGNVSSMGVAD